MTKAPTRKHHLSPEGHKYESAAPRRSRCTACGKHIVKGFRRIGIEQYDQKSHKFTYQYYHFGCLDGSWKEQLRFAEGRTLAQEVAYQDEVERRRAETLRERHNLFEQIVELRSALVQHDEFCLFELHLSDKTIEELVLQLPTSFQQLSQIWGMGPSNMELLGDGILELIGYFRRKQGIDRQGHRHHERETKPTRVNRTPRRGDRRTTAASSNIDPAFGIIKCNNSIVENFR